MARYLMIALFVASISVFGQAKILVGPQDTEAETEKTAELYCKATLGDIEWQQVPFAAQDPELVYKNGFFYEGYKERFNTSRTNDGTNVLIIRNVQPTDAGKFICQEDSEKPSPSAAELMVFEHVPSNESCVGKYTCKPVCNELELSCKMKAYGNYIPSMQWIDSERRQLHSMHVIVNETAVSTVTLTADPCVTASFKCRLTYPGTQLTSKYGWTFSTSAAKDTNRSSESTGRTETPECTQGSIDKADSDLHNCSYNTDSDSRHQSAKCDGIYSSVVISAVVTAVITSAAWIAIFVIMVLIIKKFQIITKYPQLWNWLNNNQLGGCRKCEDNISNDSVVSSENLTASNDANVGKQSEDSL